MGVKEAARYISGLQKRQRNPYVWPDFLTGLPERPAILEKLDGFHSRPKGKSVSFIRIANIHPYLIKYGPKRHTEIIKWAAAILKTTADKHGGVFVGTFGVHDFMAFGGKDSIEGFLRESSLLFKRKAKTFYCEEDRRKCSVLSFMKEGRRVEVGLMELLGVTLSSMAGMKKEDIIPRLESLARNAELSSVM